MVDDSPSPPQDPLPSCRTQVLGSLSLLRQMPRCSNCRMMAADGQLLVSMCRSCKMEGDSSLGDSPSCLQSERLRVLMHSSKRRRRQIGREHWSWFQSRSPWQSLGASLFWSSEENIKLRTGLTPKIIERKEVTARAILKTLPRTKTMAKLPTPALIKLKPAATVRRSAKGLYP